MSSFNIPNKVCDKLDFLTRRFWWRPRDLDGKFLARRAWDKLCQPRGPTILCTFSDVIVFSVSSSLLIILIFFELIFFIKKFALNLQFVGPMLFLGHNGILEAHTLYMCILWCRQNMKKLPNVIQQPKTKALFRLRVFWVIWLETHNWVWELHRTHTILSVRIDFLILFSSLKLGLGWVRVMKTGNNKLVFLEAEN